MLSPVLFCVPTDFIRFERLLPPALHGCHNITGSVFSGVLAYTDDNVLIASSAMHMHKLLSKSEEYADEYRTMLINVYAQKSDACRLFFKKK